MIRIAALCAAIALAPFGCDAAPNTVEAKFAGPVAAVVRLSAEDKWEPMLDQLVQTLPSAAPLGARWTRDNPAWKKARAVLGTRLTRIVDSYVKSSEHERNLQTAVARDLSGADGKAMLQLLEGPGGGMLLRGLAASAYMSAAMSASPNGPRPGEPAWHKRIETLGNRFDERIGAGVPPKTAVDDAAMQKLWSNPVAAKGMPVFGNAVMASDARITGAMNLMMFDDKAAILRELDAAVATAR